MLVEKKVHRMQLDLDDLTNAALKRLVQKLLAGDEQNDAKVAKTIGPHNSKEEAAEEHGKTKNDLADLHEEMHGKPNTPKVTRDDLPYEDGELPDILPPKKKKA